MAGTGASGWREPARTGLRAFEWGLLAAVILGLVLLFLQQAQKVQGQAELAAIKATLGALRTAAMLDDLQTRIHGRDAQPAGAQPNPFDLLRSRPVNYLGARGPVPPVAAPPGHWWFEPDCGCVAYAPLEPGWLSAPAGATALRFRVTGQAGPLQLVPMERYVWQNQRVD